MTIAEAAQRTGKTKSAIRRAIKSGKLKARLINGRYDITKRSLQTYVANKGKSRTHKRDGKGIRSLIER